MRFALLGSSLLMMMAIGCSSTTEDTGDSNAADSTMAACLPTNACAAPAAPPSTWHLWRHWVETPALITTDAITGGPAVPYHRGRDLFINPGKPQTIIAHFTYGLANVNLVDEDVEVYVQRDCASGWESLGIATTTTSSAPHAPVEGVTDSGGHIFFEIPQDKQLGPGRHRVRLVVRGDQSSTDLFLDIVPPKTPIFVSDVDGTLTSSEDVEFAAMLVGAIDGTHPDAPAALTELAAKGYRPLYLTARPEWLVQRTRDFLDAHGFPPGLVQTTTSYVGEYGTDGGAATFKTQALATIAQNADLDPTFGFGNMPTDSTAYATSIADPQKRIFYQISGAYTGKRIDSYTELLPQFAQLPAVCQ